MFQKRSLQVYITSWHCCQCIAQIVAHLMKCIKWFIHYFTLYFVTLLRRMFQVKVLTKKWSGRNLTWNVARLQSPSSNDFTQNFSCFYAAQGCEKIAQIWNVQFKFAQPRTRMTAVCLVVTLFPGAFKHTVAQTVVRVPLLVRQPLITGTRP
jgi:hypothetical protein